MIIDPVNIDPSVAKAAGAGAVALFGGGKELALKVFGPAADYIGEEIKNYAVKGKANIARVFEIAVKKLGEDIGKPGQVSPKVLKGVLDHGYFCEDQLTAEYIGGVLASSRTKIGRDDRGAAFLGLIGRLSAYQIRAHYLFYSAWCRSYHGDNRAIGMAHVRSKMGLFVPYDSFNRSMDFSEGEDRSVLLPHILHGLVAEALIGGRWVSGSPDAIYRKFKFRPPSGGFMLVPAARGFELQMWVGRNSNSPLNTLLADESKWPVVEGILPLADALSAEVPSGDGSAGHA